MTITVSNPGSMKLSFILVCRANFDIYFALYIYIYAVCNIYYVSAILQPIDQFCSHMAQTFLSAECCVSLLIKGREVLMNMLPFLIGFLLYLRSP